MTDYKGLNSRLVRALTALDEARDIVRDAQRSAIGTHRPLMLNLLGCADMRLKSAYDEVTRARINLTRAERADGGGAE